MGPTKDFRGPVTLYLTACIDVLVCLLCIGLLYMLDEEMKDAVSDLTAALNFQ